MWIKQNSDTSMRFANFKMSVILFVIKTTRKSNSMQQQLLCFGDAQLEETKATIGVSKKFSHTHQQPVTNTPHYLQDGFSYIQGIVKISCNYNHTLVLTDSGEVFSFGTGLHGELGNGESSHETIPCKVLFDNDNRIVDIGTGKHHSVAVASDGELYTWGRSNFGQCTSAQIVIFI